MTNGRQGPGVLFRICVLLGLVVAPFVVYSNSLDAPFVGDDIEYIERNPDIRMSPFPDYLTKLRPLNKLTYWAQLKLNKGDMPAYHLVNISLHVLASLLLFFLLKRLLEQYADTDPSRSPNAGAIPALAGALLFALHPIHTQAVNYTFARSEILCAIFVFGALLVHSMRGAKNYGYGRAIGVGCLLLLAIASKERAFMFLPCLVLFDIIVRKTETWQERNYRWYRLVLPVSLVVIAGLINFYIGFKEQHQGAIGEGQEVPGFIPYFWTEMVVRLHYLKLYLWPSDLSFDYHFPLREQLTDPVLLGAVGAHVAGLLAVLFLARRQPLIAFAMCWFFLLLLPTSGVAPAVILMHEHWIYIPSFGIFLIVAVLLRGVIVRIGSAGMRKALYAGFLGLCVFLGFVSHQRNEVWHEPLTLWLDASKHAAERAWVWNHIGAAYVDKKEYDLALEALYKAESVGEPTGATRQCIGLCLMHKGDLEGARRHMEEAIALCPGRPEILLGLGNLHKKMGNSQLALKFYLETMKAGWTTPEVYIATSQLAMEKGDLPIAKNLINEGLSFFPDNEDLVRLKSELDRMDLEPKDLQGDR